MAFKVTGIIALVVMVTAEHHPSSFYQDSLAYVVDDDGREVQDNYSLIRTDGSLSIVDSVNGFNPAIQRHHSVPIVYSHPSYNAGEELSSWNYLSPVISSGSSVTSGYAVLENVLPLTAPWTHDDPSTYSTSVKVPEKSSAEQLPLGYVAPVAKISIPPGYKIH